MKSEQDRYLCNLHHGASETGNITFLWQLWFGDNLCDTLVERPHAIHSEQDLDHVSGRGFCELAAYQ
jgi:hypothetical protein